MEHDLPLEELDAHLNGFGWEDSWDNFTGPQAKAHHLLKDLDLGSVWIQREFMTAAAILIMAAKL